MRNLLHDNENKNHRLLLFLITLLIILNIYLIVRSLFLQNLSIFSGISEKKSDAYWSLTLDTGQVFYGKIEKIDEKTVTLINAFYYQPGVSSANAENIRITKVGTELHQPQDVVHLNRSHVISRQELTSDSRVVKAIETYKGESQ